MIRLLILGYLAVGLIFSIAFVALGYKKIDPTATDAGLPVRFLWMPAAFGLWPVLLIRWIKAS